MKRLFLPTLVTSVLLIGTVVISLSGCTKEGPAGLNGADGANGANGTNGVDANETCKLCHAADIVDRVAVEFQFSKHEFGEAAFSESGNNACSVCHTQEGFKYVCANNTPSTFTFDSPSSKWVNNYSTVNGKNYGELGCFTCHSSLHTTYGYTDLTSLTTIAPVPMTMYGGSKTINLTQDGGKSNLCVKCHQPRPLTCADSRLLNYDSLRTSPLTVFFDSAGTASSNPNNIYIKPSYRMHVHYGPVGAIYAGVGGIEYPGSLPYTNSPHTTVASCQDCHMAPMTGVNGGHTFVAKGNFNGCNVSGCHATSPVSATSTSKWTTPRTAVKLLLDQLAAKINAVGGGNDILHKESDATLNLWAGLTTNKYDGYLDIYSSSTNPLGYWSDPYGSGSTNAGKPKFPKLLNVHMGAMINFQMCLREYSLGIHNTQYVTALLTNTIEALTAAGF